MATVGVTKVRSKRVVLVSKDVDRSRAAGSSHSGLPVRRTPPSVRFAQSRWRVPVVCVVLMLAVVGGVLVRETHAVRELASAKSEALNAARIRLPFMMSYSYTSIDADLEIASGNTTGAFRQDYAQLLRNKVAPFAMKEKVTNSIVVNDSSVVLGDREDVVVRLHITQSATRADAKLPVRSKRWIRVTMSKTDQGWFVSRLTES